MLAKLAISFVTFNRGKHIKENLEQIVNETEKRGIEKTGIEGKYLPSTSSANASKSLEDLVEEYHIIKETTENSTKK